MLHQSWLILSESESGDLCSQADDDDKDCSGDDDDVDNPHLEWKGGSAVSTNLPSRPKVLAGRQSSAFSPPPLSDKCSVYSGDEDFERKKRK